jgi:hypothetical protein
MFGGLIMIVATGIVGAISYGVGKVAGYDKWDKENEKWQQSK